MDSIHMFWNEKRVIARIEMTDATVMSLSGGSGGGNVSPCDTV